MDYYSAKKNGTELHFELSGSWRIQHVQEIADALETLKTTEDVRDLKSVVLDGRQLSELDTSGAFIAAKFFADLPTEVKNVRLENFKAEHKSIFELVQQHAELHPREPVSPFRSVFEKLGRGTEKFLVNIRDILSFVGETSYATWSLIRNPQLLRVKEFVAQLEVVGVDSIPICALVTFLIGIVLAYLFAGQIEKYGANIFIVDGVAVAMCREMSPIIVAIILAGRSGSAFTAQLGTMKINEEVDAMLTLGLPPMQVLVMPRFFALVIAMPLLVFVGDVVGIFGGLLISDFKLGITPYTFIDRLQLVLPVRSFFVGLIKAPVFAAFIAVIGCRMGLNVENNARSLGLHVTSTVVQSIVSVILLNAAFAVIFVEMGI